MKNLAKPNQPSEVRLYLSKRGLLWDIVSNNKSGFLLCRYHTVSMEFRLLLYVLNSKKLQRAKSVDISEKK